MNMPDTAAPATEMSANRAERLMPSSLPCCWAGSCGDGRRRRDERDLRDDEGIGDAGRSPDAEPLAPDLDVREVRARQLRPLGELLLGEAPGLSERLDRRPDADGIGIDPDLILGCPGHVLDHRDTNRNMQGGNRI